jgi:hypothetical protein
MGCKDSLFGVCRVFVDNDELHPFQQMRIRKLFSRPLPPVVARGKGNTVHLVKKIPGRGEIVHFTVSIFG